jgi:sugar lactone lactonase YvrE
MPAAVRSRACVLIVLALMSTVLAVRIDPSRAESAPSFVVDPSWPKELPGGLGEISGQAVGADGHVWIIHRGSSIGEKLPPVLEFDPEGNLLQGWGGPRAGLTWPSSEHGMYVDHRGNVWTAGSANQVMKFTRTGELLLTIGVAESTGGSSDTTRLGSAADMAVDPIANEVYIADGYGNHRVIVFDADTGAFKRMWGAYGAPPNDEDFGPRGFGYPVVGPVHCIDLSSDGLVYVCDRDHYRIQVFHKDGTFVKEIFIRDDGMDDPLAQAGACTPQCGPAFDVAFSPDPEQRFMYVAVSYNIAPVNSWQTRIFGEKENVFILDRETGRILGRFGAQGSGAGQFDGLHGLTSDADGNIYTAEITGHRIQKFVPAG